MEAEGFTVPKGRGRRGDLNRDSYEMCFKVKMQPTSVEMDIISQDSPSNKLAMVLPMISYISSSDTRKFPLQGTDQKLNFSSYPMQSRETRPYLPTAGDTDNLNVKLHASDVEGTRNSQPLDRNLNFGLSTSVPSLNSLTTITDSADNIPAQTVNLNRVKEESFTW